MPEKIRVFYNSACPVCNAGISAQKKKSVSCQVDWEDVHIDEDKAKELNTDLEFVRERLHVLDADGNLKVGYEAFITIWENSPKEQWKARVSKLPGLRWFLNKGYNVFARGLYLWNRALKHW
ncbi:thiol-disulfide oxidoreductase DCC family protein [Microbulbifer sp. JTAC008]|uniref:thiol-disulfide oxidoreductase DCC family protein n=1 Tax=unclassified Microbulbifer TaxID=2619833 RepID=UPI0040399E7B